MRFTAQRSEYLTLFLATLLVSSASAQCEEAKLLPSDGFSQEYFGHSVSLSGETALVGAPDIPLIFSGAAYVYVRGPMGWIEEARLTASDAGGQDEFGYSVSISGDTALVGSRFDDDDGTDSGSAYVFVRNGANWTEQAKLTASDAESRDEFGHSVAIVGDTALVGAFMADGAVDDTGAVYVFVRDGTTWSEQAKLTASDGEIFDLFGLSVALSGETALVGAAADDDFGMTSGSAYVFVRDGTTWSEEAKLTASDAGPVDRFGCAVSIDGDTALIGADDDDSGLFDTGSAYVFVRSGTSWSEQAKLTAPDPVTNDNFGTSVRVLGDTAVIAMSLDDTAGQDSGSVFLFERSGTSWTEQARLVASDGDEEDVFGASVALEGQTLLVGAVIDDDLGFRTGSSYVFDLTEIGSGYCATSPNSVGPGMVLSAAGSTSLSRECVALRADGGPDNKAGIFFFGPNQLAGFPFGEGLRCVGGATRRMQPPAITGPSNGNPAGVAVQQLDFEAPYATSLGAGSTNFQYWYRDPMGGPSGYNLSNAHEIVFSP